MALGLEMLAQRAGAYHYHRMHSRRRSLSRHEGGYLVCWLPGRIRTRLGHADQNIHSDDHCSGGERFLAIFFFVAYQHA